MTEPGVVAGRTSVRPAAAEVAAHSAPPPLGPALAARRIVELKVALLTALARTSIMHAVGLAVGSAVAAVVGGAMGVGIAVGARQVAWLDPVLVVGAGPAGMECARVLGMRGYDVHLREAEAEIGGRIRKVVKYPGLSEWARVATYRQIQLQKLKNVEVHTGVGKMTAEQILSYGADKVVLATGSHWSKTGVNCITHTPVEGLDASLPYVCTPEQILMENKPVGDNVLVVDGDGYFLGPTLVDHVTDDEDHRAAQDRAISPATRMLFSAILRLTARLSPPVSSTIFNKRNGVTSLPDSPSSAAMRRASVRARS